MMIKNGVDSATSWENCGAEVIADLDIENSGVDVTELTLVSLFKTT